MIISDLVDAHRISRGLKASDAVTIIVHLDEHQMLQADLIKYGSEVFPGEQQDQYYTRSRQFVEEALLPFTGTSLPNVRIFPLLTATVSFPISDASKFSILNLNFPLLDPLTVFRALEPSVPASTLMPDRIRLFRNLVSLGVLATLYPNLATKQRALTHRLISCEAEWGKARPRVVGGLECRVEAAAAAAGVDAARAAEFRTQAGRQARKRNHAIEGARDGLGAPYEGSDETIVLAFTAILLFKLAKSINRDRLALPYLAEVVSRFQFPSGNPSNRCSSTCCAFG